MFYPRTFGLVEPGHACMPGFFIVVGRLSINAYCGEDRALTRVVGKIEH